MQNYENDFRVRAYRTKSWFDFFNEDKMIVTVLLNNEDDEDEEFELPVKYAVCPTCEGKGLHVNPSIDAHGLTYDDFQEDPDFVEDYFSGIYNVSCYQCKGKRVILEISDSNLNAEQKIVFKRLEEKLRDDAAYEAMCQAERSMGA